MKNISPHLFKSLPLIVIFSPEIMANNLQIEHIHPDTIIAGQSILISGSGFSSNKNIEVIADYGHGFKYKLEITKYSANNIQTRIPDLGKNLNINVFIKKDNVSSNKKNIIIKPISTQINKKTIKHTLMIGDKGEDIFKINNKPASCHQAGEIFNNANINFIQKQFSEAQFISLPKKLCSKCKEIKILWYNEPTGQLRYQLQIIKRKISGICQQYIR